jgi:hypothetical protein
VLPAHPGNWEDNDGSGGGMEQSRGGPGHCRTCVLHCWSACSGDDSGVDPGESVLEGSNVLAYWSTDIGGKVGGCSGNVAGGAEDVLGTIAGGGCGSTAVPSAQGRWQQQLPKPLSLPLPALQASLARDETARLLSSLLPFLLLSLSLGGTRTAVAPG